MSIPTGADYHILKAKSNLHDVQAWWTDAKIKRIGDALDDIIKALELMREEMKKDQHETD